MRDMFLGGEEGDRKRRGADEAHPLPLDKRDDGYAEGKSFTWNGNYVRT